MVREGGPSTSFAVASPWEYQAEIEQRMQICGWSAAVRECGHSSAADHDEYMMSTAYSILPKTITL
jgi:hypothetical protein